MRGISLYNPNVVHSVCCVLQEDIKWGCFNLCTRFTFNFWNWWDLCWCFSGAQVEYREIRVLLYSVLTAF